MKVELIAAMALTMATALSLGVPASAGPAGPADGACASGLCGASGLSLKALDAAAREDKPAAQASSGGLREEFRRTEPQRDAWTRNLGTREDRENYNCALSFGIGGQLSKDGYVGSRVMGQTQTWRAPDGGGKP